MYTLVWTAHFTRAAGKFIKRHPELKKKVALIVRDLEKDPFQPHLDYRHPGGKQTGVQAVSITDSYRITMTVIITKKEIILLDIGSHDDVYK
jgi:mRNA-degrading endonuclease YafQ of YafQ-DinJ toxin-antitoxin module